MERTCFTFRLAPGVEAEYRRRHDEAWPELLEDLRRAGISNYTLFLQGDQVIAYAECEPDTRTAFGRMRRSEANQRWAAWFEDLLVDFVDEQGELHYAREIWHLKE